MSLAFHAAFALLVGLMAACTWPAAERPLNSSALAARLGLDADILPRVLAAGPWPPTGAGAARDRGNPLSGRAEAILLGQQLFLDPRLSRHGDVACASCHVPGLAFTDGRARALGAASQRLDRHTPTLWNIGLARWQAWDGAADSAWSQALRPLLDPREMGQTPAGLVALVASDADLACRYQAVFGSGLALPQPAGAAPEQVLTVNLARAIGTYTASLVSGRTPFDDFRDALVRGDEAAALAYPTAARRGLVLFMGRARCHFCHGGPAFSHGEFGDIGLPFFIEPGRVDPGRQGGITQLMASPYRLDGPWSAATPADRLTTWQLLSQPRNFGEFKVPGLRNVALTAPYGHDGQLADLDAVLRHYNDINLERLHADGENLLEPLQLLPAELADLRAFLASLNDPAARQWQPAPVPPCRQASGNNAAPAR